MTLTVFAVEERAPGRWVYVMKERCEVCGMYIAATITTSGALLHPGDTIDTEQYDVPVLQQCIPCSERARKAQA